MSFIDLSKQVESCASDISNWRQVRKEIVNRHEISSRVDEYITLLSLYKMLMDMVEQQLSDREEIEIVKKIRKRDYRSFISRECSVGGSVCIDTLYELSLREVEAGRMEIDHDLVKLATDAVTVPHYSREQLLRQEERIKKIGGKPSIRERILRKFRK